MSDSLCASTAYRAMTRLFVIATAWLCLLLPHVAQAEDDFLPPEKAFKFAARMIDPGTAEITFTIADGYYMYRERFAFSATGAQLGTPVIPDGKIKFDETFQKDVETYRKAVAITLPVTAASSFSLKVMSQGCADQGLCYAPMESVATLSPGGGGLLSAIRGGQEQAAISIAGAPPAFQPDGETGRIEAALQSGNLLGILPLFLLLGLGLSFTPCVLPMVPILSSIIIGDGGQVSRGRGLALSVAYSLGMALIYTAMGIAAGLAGEGLAAALQNPWVLGAFALLIAVLSLSMFDVYQLQVPAAIQQRLSAASGKQVSGRFLGVFSMGAISALIVGPCVAAPLAGALLYISQTRNVVIGGSALFAMAIGMSVPLLLVGLSAGTLLPRAGAWMQSVKLFFGILMLAMALWIIAPVTPGWVPMLGWAMLGIGYGIYLLRAARHGWRAKLLALVFAGLGLVQLVGVATGGRDALAPLAHLDGEARHTKFVRVTSLADLDAEIAKAGGKTVMLDFYADWCVSCKEMEKLTFSDPRIQARFSEMLLLQADVTANNEDDRRLLKRFNLFGPPAIIFFDKQGREISGGRVIGYQNADKFLDVLEKAGKL
ncbi:protein-disulfide reductase DsbD [Noviherbaspirillum sp. CPCC 100848]|uniref:Thiol:disulfide interchange protein DsbD n=1 Tax=Noviherbaspirillum album TaxID=3080276 RepID=A0ABU6JD30_9BURK|nr:protein-disulfide reductase DsbD [Noviherbaspirillum sp. CPCC 100848]MEC4721556.1 protein-disulfide reductase DsbD [Noviherbaspirillum sp. CPCC 100848]